MSKTYRQRITDINNHISDYLDRGEQNNTKPYSKKRSKVPNSINNLSAPPGALEEEMKNEIEPQDMTEMEEMLNAWKQFLDNEMDF